MGERDKLFEFTLSFLKAVSHSGYYDKNHPSAQKAMDGLFDKLNILFTETEKLTFVREESDGGYDVIIKDYDDEEISVLNSFEGKVADLFIPRFLQYIKQKTIESFSFNSGIKENDLRNFVVLISEATERDQKRKETEEELFNQKILEMGIRHIDIKFEENPFRFERILPWQVEMALVRIQDDLKLSPTIRNLEGEELRAAKEKIIEEVMKSISKAHVIRDFIVHSDLITIDDSILQGKSLGEKMIEVMPPHLIRDTMESFLDGMKEHEEKKGTDDDPYPYQVFDRLKVSAKLFARNIDIEDPDVESLLRELYNNGVFTLDELPAKMKNEIVKDEWMKGFLEAPQKWYAYLAPGVPVDKFQGMVKRFIAILPRLIKAKHFTEVNSVLFKLRQTLVSTNDPFGPKAKVITAAMKTLATRSNLMEEAIATFINGEKEEREALKEFFTAFKKDAVEPLFEILRKSEKKSVRLNAIGIIVELKKDSVPYILKLLQNKQEEWFVIRNAILILGDVGDKRMFNDVVPFLKHEKEKIREEALLSIGKLLEEKGLDYYIEGLQDPVLNVKLKALSMINKYKTYDPGVLQFFGECLMKPAAKGSEDFETLQINIMKIAHSLPQHLTWNGEETFKQLLLRIYNEESKKKSFTRVFSKKQPRTERFMTTLERLR